MIKIGNKQLIPNIQYDRDRLKKSGIEKVEVAFDPHGTLMCMNITYKKRQLVCIPRELIQKTKKYKKCETSL